MTQFVTTKLALAEHFEQKAARIERGTGAHPFLEVSSAIVRYRAAAFAIRRMTDEQEIAMLEFLVGGPDGSGPDPEGPNPVQIVRPALAMIQDKPVKVEKLRLAKFVGGWPGPKGKGSDTPPTGGSSLRPPRRIEGVNPPPEPGRVPSPPPPPPPPRERRCQYPRCLCDPTLTCEVAR